MSFPRARENGVQNWEDVAFTDLKLWKSVTTVLTCKAEATLAPSCGTAGLENSNILIIDISNGGFVLSEPRTVYVSDPTRSGSNRAIGFGLTFVVPKFNTSMYAVHLVLNLRLMFHIIILIIFDEKCGKGWFSFDAHILSPSRKRLMAT